MAHKRASERSEVFTTKNFTPFLKKILPYIIITPVQTETQSGHGWTNCWFSKIFFFCVVALFATSYPLITKMSLLGEKWVCSLKGQSIWVPKVYSCCYTKTRNGSYVASVPTHWTELNLHALFRITTSKEAPYLSGQLCLQFGNFVFALLEPVQEEKALKNVTLDNKELLQLRHHHNLWIWLVEQGKILALHVRHALKTIVLHVRKWNDVKLPHLRFRWQLDKKTINLYFLNSFQRRALAAVQLKRQHCISWTR